jgi:uncharacterized membrane protein
LVNFGIIICMTNTKYLPSYITAFPYVLVALGAVGFLASLALTIEVINSIKNPDFVPVCDLNPIFSCGSVMESSIANIFGFTNTLMGIAGYAVIITTGMAIIAGAILKRWYMLGLQLGTILAMIFLGSLFYTSLYVSTALCLFCMTVWAVTLPIFWYTTLYNLYHHHIKLPKSWQNVQKFILRYHGEVLIVLYVIPLLLIIQRFWYYWSTLV